jgi:hypothetical protein
LFVRYGLREWTDVTDFLEQLARRQGRLGKGGQPDIATAAKGEHKIDHILLFASFRKKQEDSIFISRIWFLSFLLFVFDEVCLYLVIFVWLFLLLFLSGVLVDWQSGSFFFFFFF